MGIPIGAATAIVCVAITLSAEPKPTLRAVTVAGLNAVCEQRKLSSSECDQFRLGYL